MATTSVVIEDELFAPRETVTIEFKGPNPISVYKSLDELARRMLEAKGTNTFEVDFRWDTTQDPRPFFVNYFIEKPFDKFTKFRVDFKFYGAQPTDPKKEGALKLEIRGRIRTEFKVADWNKWFFKTFYYFYHVAYYNARRRRYLEYLHRRVDTMLNDIRNTLKIPVRPI
jgi:hypothetical protein